jgi:hypothetical protein
VAVGVAGEGVALSGRFVAVVSRSETRRSVLLDAKVQACSPPLTRSSHRETQEATDAESSESLLSGTLSDRLRDIFAATNDRTQTKTKESGSIRALVIERWSKYCGRIYLQLPKKRGLRCD